MLVLRVCSQELLCSALLAALCSALLHSAFAKSSCISLCLPACAAEAGNTDFHGSAGVLRVPGMGFLLWELLALSCLTLNEQLG